MNRIFAALWRILRPVKPRRRQARRDAAIEWAGRIALLALIASAAWITWGAMPTELPKGH